VIDPSHPDPDRNRGQECRQTEARSENQSAGDFWHLVIGRTVELVRRKVAGISGFWLGEFLIQGVDIAGGQQFAEEFTEA
jgi:hypothetical protein